jgi:hypothetical protein
VAVHQAYHRVPLDQPAQELARAPGRRHTRDPGALVDFGHQKLRERANGRATSTLVDATSFASKDCTYRDTTYFNLERNHHNMKTLFALAAMAVVGYFVYKAGKRTGSRKGYGVGRRHERRQARRRRRR